MAARTFDAFTTPKAGVIWGLSVPQLLFLSVATFPAWMAISSQRWLAGVAWVPVWLLLLFLTVVPLGGAGSGPDHVAVRGVDDAQGESRSR